MTRYPDFVIIGAMKSATSTLHEQLALQPGISMSTPKEPNFFSDDAQYAKGLDWYTGLFATVDPDDLCGESSTHYTKLPTHPHTVERLATAVPDARFIYVMRHPIDRLVSHYIHGWTMRDIAEPIDEAIDRHPELIAYGCYAKQLTPYFERFGRERVLPMFFDRLHAHPQAELERACRHIGYAGSPRWHDDLEAQNVSRERLRASPLRDLIVYAPGISFIRKHLVPKTVRDRIKSLWRMDRRPELSAASTARLTEAFDADLKILGDWLGVRLDCANFKSVARELVPEWKATA